MNERRLREALWEAEIPGAAAAEQRALAVVESAFAERAKGEAAVRRSLPRLAIAFAIATLLAALLLSPAGASVRHWIGEVFEPGARNAQPALSRIPGGGRLAVSSPAGPWVVQRDGARRRLGDYREATWSPHGLFLAAVSGRTLTAIEPDGTPRWSITASAPVEDPRWSPSGYRIAYRAGGELRVVHADGSAFSRLAARSASVAASWSPEGVPELAFVDARGRVAVASADSGRRLASARALPGIAELEWGAGGALLEASRTAVRLRPIDLEGLAGRPRLGRPRSVSLPGAGRIVGARLSPDGSKLVVLRQFGGGAGTRSEVDLVELASGAVRRFWRTPGHLGEVVWSPDSSRLLISWPEADQWLFVRVDGRGARRGRLHAVGDIAEQFSPGVRAAAFPKVSGWCCSAAR